MIFGKLFLWRVRPDQGVKMVPGKCGEGMNCSSPVWGVAINLSHHFKVMVHTKVGCVSARG